MFWQHSLLMRAFGKLCNACYGASRCVGMYLSSVVLLFLLLWLLRTKVLMELQEALRLTLRVQLDAQAEPILNLARVPTNAAVLKALYYARMLCAFWIFRIPEDISRDTHFSESFHSLCNQSKSYGNLAIKSVINKLMYCIDNISKHYFHTADFSG